MFHGSVFQYQALLRESTLIKVENVSKKRISIIDGILYCTITSQSKKVNL
jgi:hypothetical protein